MESEDYEKTYVRISLPSTVGLLKGLWFTGISKIRVWVTPIWAVLVTAIEVRTDTSR